MTGILGPAYDEADVELLHADVLPKYLAFFNALAVERLLQAPRSALMACGPLASSIVDLASERLPHLTIRGFEPSDASVRKYVERKNGSSPKVDFDVLSSLPFRTADASFTHAMAIHPVAAAPIRLELLKEVSRVLVPAGQLIVALPLRGSYPEIADMLREYALKHDSPRFGEAIEIAAQSRPTPETLTEDLEMLGFEDVQVDVELLSVPFDTGRDFAAHPLFRLIVAPELTSMMESTEDVHNALEYAKSAIGMYWSEGQFDLTVNLGCASARKP